MYAPSPSVRLSTSRHASRLLLEQSTATTTYFDAESSVGDHQPQNQEDQPQHQEQISLKDTLNEMYNSFVEAQSQLKFVQNINDDDQNQDSDDQMGGVQSQDQVKEEQIFELINYFGDLCSDYLRVLLDLSSKRAHNEKDMNLCTKLETMLREERNSWRLARAIFSDFLAFPSRDDNQNENFVVPNQSQNDDQGYHEDGNIMMEYMENDHDNIVNNNSRNDSDPNLSKPMSDQQLIDNLFKKNHIARRMQLVIDWLEANETDDLEFVQNLLQSERAQFYTETPIAWENTFHSMRVRMRSDSSTNQSNRNASYGLDTLALTNASARARASGINASIGGKELCNAMDPDAPIRTKKPLADQDKEDEYKMFKQIFKFVRAGKLEEGHEVAISVGYHWFAAALDGWLPYSDPNLDYDDSDLINTRCTRDNTSFNTGENVPQIENNRNNDNDNSIKPITGNRKCDVWKLTCFKIAQMHGLAQYEKAILGVFGGNLRAVLPVCSRWSDQLWARLKSSIDVIIVRTLQNSNDIPTLDNEPRTTVEYPQSYYENFADFEQIFQLIEKQKLSTSCDALIHQTIQKYFVLNDIDGLLKQMSTWCNELNFDFITPAKTIKTNNQSVDANVDTLNNDDDDEFSGSKMSGHYLRFFAHVVLFLRSINYISLKNQHANEILISYINHLIKMRHVESVAFYTSTLPRSSQILTFAKLLTQISERNERKYCLKVASDFKLNIDEITQTVVELIRKNQDQDDQSIINNYQQILNESASAAGVSTLPSTINARDWRKIESLDWLLYLGRPNYVAILHQGNALMRSFALEKKLDAVRETFCKLPTDLCQLVTKQWQHHTGQQFIPIDLENDQREFQCFQLQLEVRQEFLKWSDYHRRKPEQPRKPTNINKFCDSVGYEQKMKQYNLDLQMWHQLHESLASQVASKIVQLFQFQPNGWLVDIPENEHQPILSRIAHQQQDFPQERKTLVVSRTESQAERKKQLKQIRKLYVPQLVSVLYNVLHLSQQYRQCLQIADIVAEESTKLYQEFETQQLRDFLDKMCQSAVAILKTCPDPLGYDQPSIVA